MEVRPAVAVVVTAEDVVVSHPAVVTVVSIHQLSILRTTVHTPARRVKSSQANRVLWLAFAGGRGGFGSRGGRGGFGGYNDGPPDEVVEIGTFIHAVEGEMLCASTQPTKVSFELGAVRSQPTSWLTL